MSVCPFDSIPRPLGGTGLFQTKKNPEILTYVGLPDFLNC